MKKPYRFTAERFMEKDKVTDHFIQFLMAYYIHLKEQGVVLWDFQLWNLTTSQKQVIVLNAHRLYNKAKR